MVAKLAKSPFPNHLFGFHKSCFTSNRTALTKAHTGVPPLHGSHVAILITCDGLSRSDIDCMGVSLSHDKNVVAGNPAKDCFSGSLT